MTFAISAAAIVAFIVIAGIIESRMNKRSARDDLLAAWNHGHARDLVVLRKCCNQRAALIRSERSVSSIRGSL